VIIDSAVAIAQRRVGKTGEQYFAGRVSAVIERSIIAFKSSTWIVVATGFVEPVLFLFAFGYGIGDLIGNVTPEGGTAISYAMYIAPGLLATSAMNGAIYDSTWNVFFKIKHGRLYQAMLATSLGPLDVALGEIIWALGRGLMYSVGFMGVVTPLGLVKSWWAILAIPAAVMIAFAFSAIGMAFTSYMQTYQQMDLINVALLPMFLFSGSFYPITVFPGWIQSVIQSLPLWHAIELMRALMLGEISTSLLVHVAYFAVMITVGTWFTTRRLNHLFMR
jgi:lipooligosaccharide transport system permease protein